MTSNIVITQKYEKQYFRKIAQLFIPGLQDAVSDKVIIDIYGLVDDPVVQCDILVVKSTFADDSK